MFENLKAFIRHGRQANDMKRKPGAAPYATASENPFGSGYQIVDGAGVNSNGSPSDLQYQQYQQQFEQQQQVSNGSDGAYAYATPTYSAGGNQSDVTLNEPPQQQQQQHQTTQDYDKVATQLVEEENLQKSKYKTYKNLDNYEVLEQMGEGAFSIVNKAIHKPTGKEVAIKILRKFQMDQQQKQAVLKEVTIMRQLNHANVVSFIEFIDSPDYYYIVQELVSGGEIFTMIVKYTYLSEDLSRWIITQVAHAIRYLHEEVGIVHRDIKPENLLFEPIDIVPSVNPIAKLRKSDDPNTKKDEGDFTPGVGGGGIGIVKLADFGLSKQIWEHNTKTPCGTVGYTAPEIVRDERYSKEVDMWAIGCVLYTLLCGFPPFYDERIETLTEKVAKGQFTFLQPWWDEISDGAKNCVSNLLTVDPKKRYTIDEFLQDPWMKQQTGTIPQPETTTTTEALPQHVKKSHPIQSQNSNTNAAKYSKKSRLQQQSFSQDLYSPAAVALRDAFDISTAVHRMGEEAALSNKHGGAGGLANVEDLIEEEEEENEEDVTGSGRVLHHRYNSNNKGTNGAAASSTIPRSSNRRHQQQNLIKPKGGFDLNLGGASIIERRKNKQIPIQSS
ncbi:Rck2 MAP kinase-activated protein kinase [Candida orthopsilosis Co 90-125]|uniref:Rck2 MAP kinase-activated protein kinase n=1 Tax=Candida orthopsilosis (strain 90-125) TaxID=1136231 RepID=H8X3A8_CANO9|nr:Rck2 MAP kinase-activated protein kinase [Candida orthopsilosis Co 90-125]CCG25968.1 Rck2 MAP kinase-activated protein kinase [Candida orthopsilosis Co 90-125]